MNLKTRKAIMLITAMFFIVMMILLSVMLQRPNQNNTQSVTDELPFIQVVPEGWTSLFDGTTLNGWEIMQYGGEGEPYAKNGVLILPSASAGLLTGLRWVGDSLPVNNYVIYYEARRVQGYDIFAGLSFPYKDTFASLILGGWGGIVNGISCVDGYDASENETTQHFSLNENEWYPVQLFVTTDSIRAFVGDMQAVNLATAGKNLYLRPGSYTTSLTLWTYLTTGEIRDLRIKKLP